MGITFESEWAGSEGKSRRLLRRRRVIDCRRGQTNFPVTQITSSRDQFNALAERYSQSPVHRAGASLPVLLELADPNFAVKSVRAAISSRISGKSTRGSRAAISLRSRTRLGGSSSLSGEVRTSSSLPSVFSTRANGFDERLVATC